MNQTNFQITHTFSSSPSRQNILPDVERPVHVTPGTRKNPLVEAKEKKLKEQGVIKAKEKLSKKHKAEAGLVTFTIFILLFAFSVLETRVALDGVFVTL